MILGLLVVLVALFVSLLVWMAVSMLLLARRIGEPRRRPKRRYTDGPPPAIH